MKYILSGICIVLTLGANHGANKSRADQVRHLVKAIETRNMLMNDAVGFSGEKPEQYRNFEKLLKAASKNDLLRLTRHRHGVVRCYAVWGLINNHKIVGTGLPCTIGAVKINQTAIHQGPMPIKIHGNLRPSFLVQRKLRSVQKPISGSFIASYIVNKAIERSTYRFSSPNTCT